MTISKAIWVFVTCICDKEMLLMKRRKYFVIAYISQPVHRHHLIITKTCLYNFDPLKAHFYMVYIIFLTSAKKLDFGYLLKPPRRGGCNEYHNQCFEQKYEKNIIFIWKFTFFGGKMFSIYLNRHVFVMKSTRILLTVCIISAGQGRCHWSDCGDANIFPCCRRQ